MRKTANMFASAASVVALLGSLTLTPVSVSVASAVEEGKKLAFNRKKGNCLACHKIKGGKLAGNIGPSLDGVGKRYNKKQLRDKIWDPTKINPNSSMPPFGKHGILTGKEIDKIVEYIATL